MPEVVRTETIHDLPFSAAELWPILSKTDWLNRSVGLPPVQYETTPLSQGGAKVMARARIFGKEMRWEERPFEWTENEFYVVQRVFSEGPLKELRGGIQFLPPQKESSRL